MKLEQVAAQLYTLRNHLKTPEDIAASLKKVAAIGYQAVQVSGMGPIPEEDLKKLLDDNGLTCCATHEPATEIVEETDKVIERLQKLGCKHTAYPFPKHSTGTVEDCKKLAAMLSEAGGKMRAAGITLSYHNHDNEFVKLEGTRIIDILLGEADPQNLMFEPDTFWVHLGGCENTLIFKQYAGRIPCIHMKDFQTILVPGKENPEWIERKPFFCEVGNGNLPFKEICAAAKAGGTEWYIVEQDQCPGDEFDSLKQSFDYIKANLVDE